MKKQYIFTILGLATLFLSSCATILRGDNDRSNSVTFAPAQANTLVFVNGEFKGLTPVTMNVSGDSIYNVKYVNRNFMSKSFKLESELIKKYMWMDIACLPVTAFVPLAVDAYTGKWRGIDENKVPNSMVLWSDIKDPHEYIDEFFQIENLYFEVGRDVIKADAFANLNKLAAILNQFDDVQLYIHGHTDVTGNREENIQLSKARAVAVQNYLIQKGISESRFSTDGHGPDIPLIKGDTEEAYQYNRRVEFSYGLKK